MTDPRQFAPATQRNRDPILDVLRGVLPASGLVLEIASGSGEHAIYFAQALPGLTFQPSDPNPDARTSIAAWIEAAGVQNVRPPIALDAATPPWPVAEADAVVCINMVHISPWAATEGLIRGAAKILKSGAPLFLYGPYFRQGIETTASNLAFDEMLRGRNSEWGIKHLDTVTEYAANHGFRAPVVTEMPANNVSVVLRRN